MFSHKIKQYLSVKRFAAIVLLACMIMLKLTGVMYAQAVTQGYAAEKTLQKGMIVGVTEKDATAVEPLTVDQVNRILGVVVNANDSPITISDEKPQVFVATVGRYDVLVSDEEGTVNVTDYVTVSSLEGIGMKATFKQTAIIGRAVNGFDGKTGVISTTQLKDTGGGTRNVHIGKIQVDIAVSKNPLAKSNATTPEFLGKLGQAIAGKSVSPTKIYLSVAIFLAGTFIAGFVLYSGIRTGMISIGRNPLGKKAILRGLLQVIFTSIIVFIIAVLGVYLLLKT